MLCEVLDKAMSDGDELLRRIARSELKLELDENRS